MSTPKSLKITQGIESRFKEVFTTDYGYAFTISQVDTLYSKEYDVVDRVVIIPEVEESSMPIFGRAEMDYNFSIEFVKAIDSEDRVEMIEKMKANLYELMFSFHCVVVFENGSTPINVGDIIVNQKGHQYFVSRVNANGDWSGNTPGTIWLRRFDYLPSVGDIFNLKNSPTDAFTVTFVEHVPNIAHPGIAGFVDINDYINKNGIYLTALGAEDISTDLDNFIIVTMKIKVKYLVNSFNPYIEE